jgi:hypothetical protein
MARLSISAAASEKIRRKSKSALQSKKAGLSVAELDSLNIFWQAVSKLRWIL